MLEEVAVNLRKLQATRVSQNQVTAAPSTAAVTLVPVLFPAHTYKTNTPPHTRPQHTHSPKQLESGHTELRDYLSGLESKLQQLQDNVDQHAAVQGVFVCCMCLCIVCIQSGGTHIRTLCAY